MIPNVCKRIGVLLVFLFGSLSMISAQEQRIDTLVFTGNKKTRASFLYRIAKVKTGMVIDSTLITTDIERIKRLDGVAHATFTISPSDKGGAIVTYDLKENFSIIPGLRIGEANNGEFSFRASIFEFNALGRNIIFGGFYQREVFDSYGIFIEHPYLFSNKWGLGLNFQDLTTQQPIYFPTETQNYTHTRRGPEVTVFYEHNFNNRFELGTKIFQERYSIIEGDPENEGVLNPATIRLNKQLIRGSYEYVDIDLEYQYLKGVRNLFETQFFFGSEGLIQTDYILSNTTQYFQRVGQRGNWANQLQLHYSTPTAVTPFVPLTVDNQLNTRGAGNTIDRGTALIALNTEYRHTLIEKNWFVLQGNAFVDVSGIQRQDQELSNLFDTERFRVYPGVGIRLIHKRIFNAVLRFDYGFNVTGNGDSGLVFGIGQFF